MLILDKLRAMDVLVARSERIDVPAEFRWGQPPGPGDALPSVQDAEGRRRLAHAIVLRPVSAMRARGETRAARSKAHSQPGSWQTRAAVSPLHP